MQSLFFRVYADNIKLSNVSEKANISNSKVSKPTIKLLWYNWLVEDGNQTIITNTSTGALDSFLISAVYYYKISKEADEIGLY
ncbi:hypothetical protein COF09_31425 [Bacillus toyonensis]|nr:hypothetical protein COF09_31425 [Bacillus toyonensis]